MNRVLNIVIPLIAAGLGFAGGVGWQWGRQQGRSEDLVRGEITLLQKFPRAPACDQVLAAPGLAGENRFGDAAVHWRYAPDKHKLQRVVVGPDLNTAYEELDLDCSALAP